MAFQNIALICGGVLIFIGIMRLIYVNSRNTSNVSLTRWATTGGLVEIIVGLVSGTFNWLRLRPDQNSRICLLIYLGIIIIYLAL